MIKDSESDKTPSATVVCKAEAADQEQPSPEEATEAQS